MSQPNFYGGCCSPQPSLPPMPGITFLAPCPDQPICPGGEPYHCLSQAMEAAYPELCGGCGDDGGEGHWKQLSEALKQAECLTRGMVIPCQRDAALMALAAHIIEVRAVAVTEKSSRVARVNQQVLGRPGYAGTSLQQEATGRQWLSLTVYGQQFQLYISVNPILPIIV